MHIFIGIETKPLLWNTCKILHVMLALVILIWQQLNVQYMSSIQDSDQMMLCMQFHQPKPDEKASPH